MKIVSSEQPVVRPDLPAPTPSRVSFAALLGASASWGRDPGRPAGPVPSITTAAGASGEGDGSQGDGASRVAAATFDAFGMFGRRADVTGGEPTPVAEAGRTLSLAGEEALELKGGGLAAAPETLAAAGAAAPGAGHADTARPQTPHVAARTVQGGDPSVGDTASPWEGLTADEGDTGPVAARRRATRVSAKTDATARVTLFETAQSASLALRSAGLSAEDAAQFRARARILLGEHGLRLDTLEINGEDRSASDRPAWEITPWR